MSRVSVVIVTWNALPLLQRFLPSVAATTYPDLELILADNASTDGSADWVAAHYPQIRTVRHPENWLFARGNNEALAHATGDYVCLLNNDVEVPPDWLDPLVAVLDTQPDVAAVQPKLLQVDQRTHFEYAGGSGGFLDRYAYPFTRGRLFFTQEADAGQYDDACDVAWASGACILLRRAALDAVGLLDERFGMHMEEIDLCWRLWRAGWRVRVEPRSRVYHLGGGSLPQGNPRKTYYNFRNNLLMAYKNLPPGDWLRAFPVRLLIDGLAALRALLRGQPADTGAILRAYADAHRMKGAYAQNRATPADPQPPHYAGSVVWAYQIRGQQKFAALPQGRFRLP